MKDTLIKATAAEGSIRLLAVLTTNTTKEAQYKHSLSFLTTALIGRAISTSLLLASSMKVKQARVTLKVQSDGPLKGLFVDAGKDGTARGYVGNPALELDLVPRANGQLYFDFAKASGKGYLHVTRDIGKGEPFTSTVELIEGGIGEDIASYLLHSEQTQSAVFVGEKIENRELICSGALIAQVIPKGINNNSLLKLLNDECQKINSFSETLFNSRNDFTNIFNNLFPSLQKEEINIIELNNQISFNCGCSFQRSISAIKLLGKEELTKIIKEEGKSELTCKFCNTKYIISKKELNSIISEL